MDWLLPAFNEIWNISEGFEAKLRFICLPKLREINKLVMKNWGLPGVLFDLIIDIYLDIRTFL